MAYPCCDVTKTLLTRLKSIIQVTISPKVKQIQQFCKRLLYIILESLSNETIKMFVAISL